MSTRPVRPIPASWLTALQRGRDAIKVPAANPYARGTQCWLMFEKGRDEAANAKPEGRKP